MEKLLNTIHLTDDALMVDAVGDALEIIRPDKNEKNHVPCHMIASIIVHGNPTITNHALEKCAEKNIGVYFLDHRGNFRFSIQGPTHGNVLVRKRQYLLSESEERLSLARQMLKLKVKNSYLMLERFSRNHESDLDDSISQLKEICNQVDFSSTLGILMGIEGSAAKKYFSVFDKQILVDDVKMHFHGRNRRPPKDCCNAMLSYAYTLLMAECVHALETCGLDPYVGFIHADRPGKPSLALDLMEELRPFLADRFVIKLINLKIIQSEHFEEKEDGGVYLNKEGKKRFFHEWNKFRTEEFQADQLGKISKGQIPYIQARQLSAIIRGEKETYEAISWR